MKSLADYKLYPIKEFQASFSSDSDLIPHIDDLKIQKESVCANDDRVKADNEKEPFKYISELHLNFNGYLFRASGFFISPKCVITAGHCLYNHEMGWATSVKVIPGPHKNGRPFSFDSSNTFQTTKLWYNNAIDDYDHGAIFLDSDNLYNQIQGHFEYDKITKITELINSGYPKDKASVQYTNKGLPKDISNTRRLYYMIDTNKGSSGSPVLIMNGNRNIVVGVHIEGGCPNSAIKVNNEVIEIWDKWVQISKTRTIS